MIADLSGQATLTAGAAGLLYPGGSLYPAESVYPGVGPAIGVSGSNGVSEATLLRASSTATLAPQQIVVATLQILELVT